MIALPPVQQGLHAVVACVDISRTSGPDHRLARLFMTVAGVCLLSA